MKATSHKLIILLFASMLLTVAVPCVSNAQTYSHIYVDAVNGVNAATGRGAAAAPYKTITYAFLISNKNSLPDPWHVHIRPGTYDADPAKPVTAREIFPLKLRHEMIFEGTTMAAECIIDGQHASEISVPLLHGEGPVTIRNLTVQNSLRTQEDRVMNVGGIVLDDPTGEQRTPSTLDTCIIHNNKGGGVWSNMPLVLTGNTFSYNYNDNVYDGIYFWGGGVVISGNTTARGSRTDVTDNVFSHNGAHGLEINGNFVGNVTGNIFQDTSRPGKFGNALRVHGTLRGDVTHNTFTRNGTSPWGTFGAALIASNLIGSITNNTFEKNMGGAILISSFTDRNSPHKYGDVTGDIAYNTFTDNTNPSKGSFRGFLEWEAGGFVVGNLTGNVIHNTFTRNIRNDVQSGRAAGGFVILGTHTGNVTHNTFTGNNLPFPARGSSGGGNGGGSGGFKVTTLIGNVTDNNFTNNSAVSLGHTWESKGGGFQIDALSGNISRNIFDTNSTSGDGGGFWVGTLSGNISHNKFTKNSAPADEITKQKLSTPTDVDWNKSRYGGGGFWVNTLSGNISHNMFDRNFGLEAGSFWVKTSPNNVVEVFNNIFIDNNAYPENSWVSTSDATHFMNNLFMISDFQESEVNAFAIKISSPNSRVHNNIFSGVKTAIYITESLDLPITHNLFHNVKISFVNQAGNDLGNDLEFWELFAVNATNNLDGAPRFVDLTTQDFHLQATSAAINAGTNEFAPADDFDGITRPAGNAVDIGPYEYDAKKRPDTVSDVTDTETPTTDVPDTGTPDVTETEVSTTDATVNISPASVAATAVGEQIEFSLNITNGEAVAGYQATVQFDTTALRYVSSANGDYLPDGAFFVKPVVEGNLIKLNAASLTGESKGDGTLAKFTFEVIVMKASTLTLFDVLLTDSKGTGYVPNLENAQITEAQLLKGDVNGDGVVDIRDLVLVASNLGKTGQNAADVNTDGIVDIRDLVLVAGALGTTAAAPSLYPQALEILTAAEVKQWLSAVQQLDRIDARSLRGILFLQQLLTALTPKETALLANYPNPFNPETWIPYQLAKPADVTVHIYAADGKLVRTLALGHQVVGKYHQRSRAAYWDGNNAFGESVASGLYFYTLTAGDFTATRKMLIRK